MPILINNQNIKNLNLYIILVTCLTLLPLLEACKHSVLSQKKMEAVLYDLHKAEGILQTEGYYVNNGDVYNKYMVSVLKKHNVTQQEFDSSLVWYTAHPNRFEDIYPKVIKRLENDLTVLNSLILAQQTPLPLLLHKKNRAFQYYVYTTAFTKQSNDENMKYPYPNLYITPAQIKYYWKWKCKFLYLKID